ncbi:MAG: hypothetical protein Q8O68_00590 [Candidatus Daviesbacteria bacterium]|nr:hypothetical protein [Candidatus Daviesbacteria bacterium]
MGRIYEEIVIDGIKTKFLIDTGSDLVSVDRSIYPKLVEKTEFSIPTNTATGVIKKRIGIGELNIRGCKIKAIIGENHPLDHQNKIGSSLLQDLGATIDEQNDRLILHCPTETKDDLELLTSLAKKLNS